VIRAIHHIGIAVTHLTEAYRLYCGVLGLPLVKEAAVPDQGVRAALLAAGESEIELLEPLGPGSGLARFLDRHGEGLHHVCFDTADVAGELGAVKAKGAELIDAVPRAGLAGQIAFLHPRACAGVLVELATPAGDAAPHASPLRLKRLIIGAGEPRATAGVFQRLFGLEEITMNGGPRVMLSVGRGTLLIVPGTEVGGVEGMLAVSMVSEDFDRLVASVESSKTPALRGTGEITLEPAATHGVHLHISRYE
jgi:methylmalonyl-CoA/ethylmalonyl-CoA epimerase